MSAGATREAVSGSSGWELTAATLRRPAARGNCSPLMLAERDRTAQRLRAQLRLTPRAARACQAPSRTVLTRTPRLLPEAGIDRPAEGVHLVFVAGVGGGLEVERAADRLDLDGG